MTWRPDEARLLHAVRKGDVPASRLISWILLQFQVDLAETFCRIFKHHFLFSQRDEALNVAEFEFVPQCSGLEFVYFFLNYLRDESSPAIEASKKEKLPAKIKNAISTTAISTPSSAEQVKNLVRLLCGLLTFNT